MAVEAVLFIDDAMHASKTDVSSYTFSTTSTEVGYERSNIRETEYGTAWKPSESAADQWTRISGPADNWLGSIGATAYCVMAYDARMSEQTTLRLHKHSADDPASGGPLSSPFVFTLDQTRPCCQWGSFIIPTGTGQKHYMLYQSPADRTGSGLKTCRVFGWSLYPESGVFRIGSGWPSDTTGPGTLDHVSNVQAVMTASQCRYTNRIAQPQQEVELSFVPASILLWRTLRDAVYGIDGPKRAFYAQFEGLRNPAQQDFAMVRMVGERVTGYRRDRDQVEVTITLITEPYF